MPIPLSHLLTPYSGGAGGTMMITLEIYNVVGLVSHRTEKASLPDTVLFYSYSNLPVCKKKKNDSWLFMNSQSSQFSAPVGKGVSKTQEIRRGQGVGGSIRLTDVL